MASLVFALASGLCYYFSGQEILLLGGALFFLVANSLLDSIDGQLARDSGRDSRYGDFLDHVVDRYSDIFIIFGIIFGGYLSEGLGALVIVGVLLARYLGTQAQAVGVGRVYGGIMGRADRMVIISLATAINLVYTPRVEILGAGFPILGWALIAIGLASHVTALQRIWQVREKLKEKR